MKTFKHSGDIGDLIYALPTIRALGGGYLYLSKSDFTRVPMSGETLANIEGLLESQPYIEGVAQLTGEWIDFNLDRWRERWDTRNNIAEQHLKAFRLPVSELEKPWLEATPQNVLNAPVLFNRTARHQNPLFPWRRVIDRYWMDAGFVGTFDEYVAFIEEFNCGIIPQRHTPTLLELAQAIAGCQLFIGNQSAAYAIAEGLKKPVVQEVYLPTPNCIFKRPGAQFVTGSEIELPELR